MNVAKYSSGVRGSAPSVAFPSNAGTFAPGTLEVVLNGKDRPRYYRNRLQTYILANNEVRVSLPGNPIADMRG